MHTIKLASFDGRALNSARRVRAVPDEAVVPPASDITAPSSEALNKTTFTTSPTVRSHPLDEASSPPSTPALPRQEWLLGGAAIVVLAGVATALLQRRQMPAARALPATSTLAETNDIVVASSESSSQSLSSPPTSPKPSYWWELREIFIVADQGDGQNPATAGPILFQAAGRAIMPAFQDQAKAKIFAASLKRWDREGDSTFGHRTANHTGHFHVVMLSPADLNVRNVPDIVLVPASLIASDVLASADTWRAAMDKAAAPQLKAWKQHMTATADPTATAVQPAGQSATTPTPEEPPVSPPAESMEQPSAPTVAMKQLPSTQPSPTDADTRTDAPAPHQIPHGPPPPGAPSSRAEPTGTTQPPAATDSGSSSAPQRNTEPRAAVTSGPPPPPAAGAVAEPRGGAAGPPPPPPPPSVAPAAAAEPETAPPQAPHPTEAPQNDTHSGPKVYASIADLEADKQWDTAAGGGDAAAPSPQEELRLLSSEETDASAVHASPGSLQAVFTPVLMRVVRGSAAEDRMMFTVDTTLDQGDPDVVALAFEDPVDANAMLSMLAHVQGFTDGDGVVRRVVPMPPGAAADAARDQGASLLCMARGFRAKAGVRAGRDINGVLSRIAGARWASLMAQHQHDAVRH